MSLRTVSIKPKLQGHYGSTDSLHSHLESKLHLANIYGDPVPVYLQSEEAATKGLLTSATAVRTIQHHQECNLQLS